MIRNLVRIKREKLASFILSEMSHMLSFLAPSPEFVSFLKDADNFCRELFVFPSAHPWSSKTPGLRLRNSPPHGSSAGGGTSGVSGEKPSARNPLTVVSRILGSRWVLYILRVFIVIDGGFGDILFEDLPLDSAAMQVLACGFEMHCEEVPVLLIGREGGPCFARYHMVYATNMMQWHMVQPKKTMSRTATLR